MRWKWTVILVVLLGCVFGIIGFPRSKTELLANWGRNIRLGLDLRGGSQIVLEVQVQDAFKSEADRAIERLKQVFQSEKISYGSLDRSDPDSVESAHKIQINLRGINAASAGNLSPIAEDVLGEQWILSPDGENGFKLRMRKEAALNLSQETMTQSIRTIQRRVDEFGIAETSVQQRGGDRETEIQVQLPGIDDPARVKRILQTTALLEFAEVIEGPFQSQEAAVGQQGRVLRNTRVIPGRSSGDGVVEWWLLARSPVITGRDLRDARAQRNELSGRWDTGFALIPDAARRFEQFTQAQLNRHLAIVLDNSVLSAPRIEEAISGQGRIIGAANAQEAADLALNLRAGSLPAGVKVLKEGTVGASLGADSIRQGITAGTIGLALVVASMVAYYRGAGFNAVIALLLNTIIIVAALSSMGAAWTLPGIAGLVLSIGMGVDSNVLIFERIKEEMRNGKRVAAAIASGFDRALVTIIDTHVTTVVASAFLFLFGTGPVRGFAVTLAIGLAANLFTAVFVSRAIFDVQLRRKPRVANPSIGSERLDLFVRANLDFMGRRKWTLGLSALMIALSLSSIVRFGLKPGLDFRGGTQVEIKFAQNPGIDTLRRTLASKLHGEFIVQETSGPGEFTIGTELGDEARMEQTRQTVEETLREKGPFEIRSTGLVGPRAGADMRSRALLATLGALGGMLIYVAFRFQWISGVVAVIATIHDVAITLGLFSLTGREINLNIIAALLTLIGYSMNDKIVVFDRVRENERAGLRGISFLQLVNHSINQTLSRTILTAGPTLLACLALYFWGGEVLNGIAFALFAGIVAGTYSSIFVASALLVVWREWRGFDPRDLNA
jgi:protein-export membrane protein SecD/preprotein translocase SecF subunit